ncbi:MAG: LemA family protein [Paucimonas sp.]|jgi:LemA protein|nr:LemA family protein [Paucimonas sp.]
MSSTLVTLLVIAAVVAIVVISLYNSIIGGANRAQRAWSDVLTYERQKTRVLDALQQQVGSYKEYEQKILTDITRLRSAIHGLPDQANGQSLVGSQQATRELLNDLRVVFEAYPDLKAAEVVNNLMREIAEQQENVGAAVVIFNGEVERFNNTIQMFPGSLVNGMLNKKSAIVPFSDSEASRSFEYKPNF